MRIAYVASEVHPFSKTGGLADVAAALPGALAELGVEVTVFSPCYRSAASWLAVHDMPGEELTLPNPLQIGTSRHDVSYRFFEYAGRRAVLVINPRLYDRSELYVDDNGRDYADNAARFSFFCRAVLEYYLHLDDPPDLFHANDWQAALIPVYLKSLYRHPRFIHTRSLLTVHNLGYQGLFPADQFSVTGLPAALFDPAALEYWGQVNLLKGGIVFADAVTTVSPTYAEEVQTEGFGMGLDGVMRAHRHKLTGILNGIDTREWDPASDPHCPAAYTADNLAGKRACKRALQQRLGLPVRPRTFLVGAISRLDAQKGIELIFEAFPRLASLDVQLVLLGSGARALEAQARDLAAAYPQRVAVVIGFDEPLAHLIEAGADALLMPSAYEPCGLNQMYSQRYGTIPIARATGGLADTVHDASAERLAEGTASGFTFHAFDAGHFTDAIRRAARLYFDEPKVWNALVVRCMQIDHSWAKRARAYLRLYEQLLAARPS